MQLDQSDQNAFRFTDDTGVETVVTQEVLQGTRQAYEKLLSRIGPMLPLHPDDVREHLKTKNAAPESSLRAWSDNEELSRAEWDSIKHWYNRVSVMDTGVEDEALLAQETHLGRTQEEFSELECAYTAETPSITYIDNILSQDTVDALYKYALGSTVWTSTKAGYLGAYMRTGFSNKLMGLVADELKAAMPHMFCSFNLEQMWMYKYDSILRSGIETHADPAVVNVNIWLTPDDALINSEGARDQAGLVVYTVAPSLDWSHAKYNGASGRDAVRELLKENNYENVTVPYKQNRAVIFDSHLLHHSGKIQFKKGYKNRRINLTLLFGRKENNECVLPKGIQPFTEEELDKCRGKTVNVPLETAPPLVDSYRIPSLDLY